MGSSPESPVRRPASPLGRESLVFRGFPAVAKRRLQPTRNTKRKRKKTRRVEGEGGHVARSADSLKYSEFPKISSGNYRPSVINWLFCCLISSTALRTPRRSVERVAEQFIID